MHGTSKFFVRMKNLKKAKFNEGAIKLLKSRYLMKKENGQETPEEMLYRVASSVAKAEMNYSNDPNVVDKYTNEFYDMMADLDFLPNTPTLINAGKDNGTLSACYVLPVDDSMSDIFDSLKSAALIHKGGGGCISGDAHIITTLGINTIESLYDYAVALNLPVEKYKDHSKIDISKLNITTISLNPSNGCYEPSLVTHVWQYDVPINDRLTVRLNNGTIITTSCWHPFMVYKDKKIVEVRADELKENDIISIPNKTVQDNWPFNDYKNVDNCIINEDIAWLIGYWLGNGSFEFHNDKLHWYVFDGRIDAIEKARKILSDNFSIKLSIQRDKRRAYSLTTLDTSFTNLFCKITGITPGPKADSLLFPDVIVQSPITVIGAFLAGLLDSNGIVDLVRRRISFSTTSNDFSRKLLSLCSTLGLSPYFRRKEKRGKGKLATYEVTFSSANNFPLFVSLCSKYMTGTTRKKLKNSNLYSSSKRLQIPFSDIEDILQSIGIETKNTAIYKKPICIGNLNFWFANWKEGYGIDRDTLKLLVNELKTLVPEMYYSRLSILESIAYNSSTVDNISTSSNNKPFYDLTVQNYSNYIAGEYGMAAIHNTGFDFSRLRPEGSLVASTGGQASGSISFMKVYNSATDVIKQGGARRGASMGVLRVDHEDIIKFITCKDKEGELSNFNISVAITDEFMQAVKNNTDYSLRQYKDGEYVPTGKTLNAKHVWDLIVKQAWKNGEPGVIFIDRINENSPIKDKVRIEATNPCVSGDTLILTDKGYRRIDECVDEQVTIWNGHEWSSVTPRITGYNQPLLKITFSDGSDLVCTPYHKFLLECDDDNHRPNIEKVEAKDLKVGDKLAKFSYPVIEDGLDMDLKEAYTRGVYSGDGFKENNRECDSIWLYDEKKNLLPHLLYDYVNECDGDKFFVKLPNDMNWDKEFVPLGYNLKVKLAWLAGLLDMDASYNGSSYSIWSVNRDFLYHIKIMLHTMGIGAILALGKLMPDGKNRNKEYNCQNCWRLNISSSYMSNLIDLGLRTNRIITKKKISMSQSRLISIKSIKEVGNAEKVYCFTEMKRHMGMFGCVATSNCGEQPLPPYGSCLSGDTTVLTDDGVRYIKDVAYGSEVIGADDEMHSHYGAVYKGKKEVLHITLSNGNVIKATPDHLFEVSGIFIPAKELHVGTTLRMFSKKIELNDEYDAYAEWVGLNYNGELPEKFMDWSLRKQLSFLRGLFTSCGEIKDGAIYLRTNFNELIHKVLLTLGIRSNNNGEYLTVIGDEYYAKLIGFSTQSKIDELQPYMFVYSNNEEIIENIVYGEPEDVYDIMEVAEVHTFYADGVPVHNCNLGSINLSNMVKDGELDVEHLKKVVRLAVRFLDDVIDVNKYPLPEMQEMSNNTRFIGLGIMGLADMLFKLGIPYNSEKGVATAAYVMSIIQDVSEATSTLLATGRGAAPWDSSKTVRNMTRTTIAPTGSLSMLAGCSSGCEPVFMLAYTKTVLDNVKFREVNEVLIEQLRKNNLYSEEILDEICKSGSIQKLQLPDELKRVFVTSLEIEPYWHIKMQAELQKYVDNAVSKTINFPNSATIDDIKKSFELAYELGCKGLTVYRNGSRNEQVLTVGTVNQKVKQLAEHEVIRTRPKITNGSTIKYKIGCGSLFVTVNSDNEGICEVFTNTGKSGGCPSQSEATARLISLALRGGIPIEEIIEQLGGIRCMSCVGKKLGVTSCPDAISKALKIAKANTYEIEKEVVSPNVNLTECPECKNKSVRQEGGCWVCSNCGYSKCG